MTNKTLYSNLQKIHIRLKSLYLTIQRQQFFKRNSFWLRALICWIFASLILKLDAVESYDTRFKIRGNLTPPSEIVLVTINPNDFAQISKAFSTDSRLRSLINLNELNNVTDSFFWDEKVWTDLLSKILNQNPKKIGVTFYFGDPIGRLISSKKNTDFFKNPKIIWASNLLLSDKASLPFTSLLDKSNVGSIDVTKDDDGIVRRLLVDTDQISNLAFKLTESNLGSLNKNYQINSNFSAVLNYNERNKFQTIKLSSILKYEIPKYYFTNKIVLIGSEKSNTQQILTPLGQLSRTEFWANATQNALQNKFITKLPTFIYIVLLFLLMLIAVFIITNYPQTVSFFFYVWVATLWTAFSIWAFDTFAVWIPIASAYSLLVLIWITHMGFQAFKIEKAHYKLQQEQNYLSELEQLKNNFVSLISHDLKTPIAKIQAVVDRLALQNQLEPGERPDIKHDLVNLKDYSEELNKYIQSILKLLRVESKEFKIHKETADLNGVIENVIERLLPLANVKNLQFKLKLEPMFLIEFDVTLMTEVILNLVENAIKYTAQGGLIFIHTTESENDVLVEIKDTGEGISTNDLEHIWKKFSRGKNQDLKTKGSGLGLYLVKYFIELHGGKISVKSELEKGTTFYIRLPIDLSE